MIYSYKCAGCGSGFQIVADVSDSRDVVWCSVCGCENVKRDYRVDSPRINPVWPDHFNPSVGKRIHSKRELSEALKLKSDEMSAKTGLEHNYVMRSAADVSDTIK
jgi:hypothetical protein